MQVIKKGIENCFNFSKVVDNVFFTLAPALRSYEFSSVIRPFNQLGASVPSYRNQSIDLHSKSIDWFLYEGNTGT